MRIIVHSKNEIPLPNVSINIEHLS